MLKYQDFLLDMRGNVLAYADVLVKTTAGATATLYSDVGGSVPQANPTTTDVVGHFSFFAAPGHYNLIFTLPDGTSDTITEIFLPVDTGTSTYVPVALPIATASVLGGIKVGTGLTINAGTGVLSTPIASASVLGGIKVGTGLTMDAVTALLSNNLRFAYLTSDDGTTSCNAELTAAIATGLPIVLGKYTSGEYRITGNISLPSGSQVWGLGGKFVVDSGITLTVSSAIQCPADMVLFDVTAGGLLAGNPRVTEFYANWIEGCDRTYVTDAGPAINTAIKLCTGTGRPAVRLVGGRYKIATPILKPSTSFNGPVLIGQPGGTSVGTGGVEYGTQLDASASGFIDTQAVIKFYAGDGHLSNMGMKDIQIVGNAVCIGVQVSGATGVFLEKCHFINCGIGVDLLNDSVGHATEWTVMRDCVFQAPTLYGVRMHLSGGGALDSFHGCRVDNCWFNLGTFADSCAFYIGTGVQWYDGHIDCQVFMRTSTTMRYRQYVFRFQSTGGKAVQCGGGSIALEGGARVGTSIPTGTDPTISYCRLCDDRGTVWYGGSIASLIGFHHGGLFLVDSSTAYGPEGVANGTSRGRYKRYGFFNVRLDSGVNTFAVLANSAVMYDIIIESTRAGALYYSRHTGMAQYPDHTGGAIGRWLQFQRPRLQGVVAYAGVVGLADGAGFNVTVPCVGATLGGYAQASFNHDLFDCLITAHINLADEVDVRVQNETTGPVTIAAGNFHVSVERDLEQGWVIQDTGGWGETAISVDASGHLIIANANFPAKVDTTVSVDAAALATTIELTTVVGIVAGDHINITLDNDESWGTTVSSVGATNVVIQTRIPPATTAPAGNAVAVTAARMRFQAQPWHGAFLGEGEFVYTHGDN